MDQDNTYEWQQQALELLNAGHKDGIVRLQLRRMGCAPEKAHEVVAQCRAVVKGEHRTKGLAMIIVGLIFGLPLVYVLKTSFDGTGIGGYVIRGPILIAIGIGAATTLGSALLGAVKLLTGTTSMPKDD